MKNTFIHRQDYYAATLCMVIHTTARKKTSSKCLVFEGNLEKFATKLQQQAANAIKYMVY
jgi:hypothetical protein